MLRATGHIPLFLSENHVLHTFDKLPNLTENSSDLRCRFTLVSKKMRLRLQKSYIHSNRACVLFFILPVVMVQTIIHTHVGIAHVTWAYAGIISPYPTLPLGT